MGNKYELRDRCGIADGQELFGWQVTPHQYDVKDKETGKTVGTVTAWSGSQAGEKIAEGDWDVDEDYDDEEADDD